MEIEIATEICQLCNCSLPKRPIVDEGKEFCCMGCHAVYKVLSIRQELSNYKEHPFFKQALLTGIISNPELQDAPILSNNNLNTSAPEWETLHFEINEMWCPSCAKVIMLVLSKEKGIQNCIVDYPTDLASLKYNPRLLSKELIFKKIEVLGYRPESLDAPEGKKSSHSLFLRFIVAAFCALNIMMFSYPIYASYFDLDGQNYASLFSWLSLFASIPLLTYCLWPMLRRFFINLQQGILGMEALVMLGVFASFFLSSYEMFMGSQRVYFDSMAVIITFLLLGKILESKAKFSANYSLSRLYRAIPRRVRKRCKDGRQEFVLLKDLMPGDIFITVAGEKLVSDGTVIEGKGTCDESLITGESIPIPKEVDSSVLGGSLLQSGWLACQLNGRVNESTLHKIVSIVESDMGYKSKYIRYIDPIVQLFVPSVIIFAVAASFCSFYFLNATLEQAIIRGIAVLLISCPCAIGIAAPIAESYLINALAKMGAIIRNRGCIQFLGKETIYICDKTGTITEGKFRVSEGFDSLTEHQLSVLKGLSSQSTHPMSKAISDAIPVPFKQLQHIEEFAGKGLRGSLGGHFYYLGSRSFLEHHGIYLNQKLVARLDNCDMESFDPVSKVFFAEDRECIGIIKLRDNLRKESQEVIQSLSSKKTVLLSGDTASVVEAVAKECQFSTWLATCHPKQKGDYVRELREQGEIVCMIGDGINDAPALTTAHIGISMATATDISIQISDISLTTNNLKVIPVISKIAKKGRKIIKQNLFWAFFYNVMGIPLAAFGMLSPLFAAFAMVVSSFIVLFNAQRLNRYRQ